MFRTAGLLMVIGAALAWGAEPRYARLGEFEGTVETRGGAASGWMAAARNLPLTQGFQVRTGSSSRVEVEFDDGCVLRLGGSSIAEISDYTRLSTGQRITLISIEQGLAYFTGEPGSKDAISLTAPGLQAALGGGSRIRLEAAAGAGQIAILEGGARLLTRSAELSLHEGQTARVNVSEPDRFQLYREVAQIDLDGWSEQRDRLLASAQSASHAPSVRAGMADLDGAGTWIESAELGPVWRPAVAAGWAPFRNGKWMWYDGPGYTWVSREPWGWAPYHYGRWTRLDPVGWVWAAGQSALFSPGEVYWMRASNLAGWGPLAAGEQWDGASVPRLYLAANTTFARFAPGAREINPEGFAAPPKDPLAAASFTAALLSPPVTRARSEAPLRQAEVRFLRNEASRSQESAAAEPVPPAPAPSEPPQAVAETRPAEEPQMQPVVVVPVPQPQETYYPVPVYTGVVVVNPPERNNHRRDRNQPSQPTLPAKPAVPAAPPAPAAAPAPRGIERVERNEVRRSQQPSPPPPEVKREEKQDPIKQDPRVPRTEQSGGRGKQ